MHRSGSTWTRSAWRHDIGMDGLSSRQELDADAVAARLLDPRTTLILATAGVIRDPTWSLGPRQVREHVLHAVLAGGHRGWAGGLDISTRPGDLLWLPPGVEHALSIDRRAGRPRILRLRCRIAPDPGIGPLPLVRHLPLAGPALDVLIGGPASDCALRAALALLAAAMRNTPSAADLPRRRLDRLRRLLADEPAVAWTPALAAAALGCTVLAASRSLRSTTGLPLRRWLLEERLRLAAGDLGDGAAVAQAARRHGWRDTFLFSRQFRRVFGVPPSRWNAASSPG